MERKKLQGCFAVRFVKDKKLGVRFEFTGEHWSKEELLKAVKAVDTEVVKAIADHSSPIYLIPEQVVKCAMHHLDDPSIVTQMLMYAVSPWSYGCMEQLEKIVQSVTTTIGGANIDIPWGEALTEKEVQDIFDAFDVKANKSKKG
jgi:hypothetical protein